MTIFPLLIHNLLRNLRRRLRILHLRLLDLFLPPIRPLDRYRPVCVAKVGGFGHVAEETDFDYAGEEFDLGEELDR